jgi:hypothetical protein
MNQRAASDTRPGGLFAWYTPGHSDQLGDRLRLFDNTDGPPLELLRLRPDLAASAAFERALRARVEELRDFHDERYARVCRTDRLPEPGGGLAVVSERTEGPRLSEMLRLTGQRGVRLPASLTLTQIANLVDAVAALHARGSSLAHGALGPERLVVGPDGRLLVTEYVLGSALSGLCLDPDRAWRQFGLALPAEAAGASFDQRTDVVQIGTIALALVLSRVLTADDHPGRMQTLVLEADRRAGGGGWDKAWPRFRPWLERALALDGAGFPSALEARGPLSELLGTGPPPLPERGAWDGFQATVDGADTELPIIALDDWERSPGVNASSLEAPAVNRADAHDSVSVPAPEAESAERRAPDRPSLHWPAPGTRMRAVLFCALVVFAIAEGVYIAGRTIASQPAAATARATVSLASDPAAAAVTVDGKPSGHTPVSLELAAGPHRVEMSKGGRHRTVTVDAKAGQTMALVLDLGSGASSTGQLRVSTTPSGARVAVDGRARGTTPLLVADLAPGDHEVLVEGRGRSVRQAVTVEAGVTAALLLPLAGADAPSPGWLAITSTEEVQVFNGGELLGTSRTPRIMLPAGRHELELVNEDLGIRASHEVVVPVGRTATLELTLPTARIDVNATPWAEVWVDGARIGETPLAGVPVPVGRRVVTFKHPQLGERRVECLVSLKRPTRLGVDLRK